MTPEELTEYLPHPPLDVEWAAAVGEFGVSAWMRPEDRRWKPPRALQRVVEPWTTSIPTGAFDVLVLLVPLDGSDPLEQSPAWAQQLAIGGQIIEIAAPRRRPLGQWLIPRERRRQLQQAGVQRARYWLDRGVVELAQWAPIEPRGVLLTMGRLGAFHRVSPLPS